jgi:hypothetical protein
MNTINRPVRSILDHEDQIHEISDATNALMLCCQGVELSRRDAGLPEDIGGLTWLARHVADLAKELEEAIEK